MAGDVKKTAENQIGKGKAGPGRPKGVPNKATAAVKDMVLAALNKAGGEDYLVEQSEKNPTAFLTLVGKVLPLDVNNKHEGAVKILHVPFAKTPLDE
jgi:FixJ family two-component response regulator